MNELPKMTQADREEMVELARIVAHNLPVLREVQAPFTQEVRDYYRAQLRKHRMRLNAEEGLFICQHCGIVDPSLTVKE